MASCHAWNQPSGNVAVEKKKKKNLWGVVSKRAVAMATQWRARRCWMLVSMGHRTSDRVWSSRGCNDCREVCWQAWWASLLQPGPWNLGSPLSLKASFFGPRSKKKAGQDFPFTERRFSRLALHMQMSVFNCCSSLIPNVWEERGNASEDVYSNEIFKASNEIFRQFGVSMGDSASGAAFKKIGSLL